VNTIPGNRITVRVQFARRLKSWPVNSACLPKWFCFFPSFR